jgi:hypothetical protein
VCRGGVITLKPFPRHDRAVHLFHELTKCISDNGSKAVCKAYPLSCGLGRFRRKDDQDYVAQTQTVYVFVDGSLKFFHKGLHILGFCGVKELSTEFANPILHEKTPHSERS